MKKCPDCGAKISPGHNFCLSCGSKINYDALQNKFVKSRRNRILWLILFGFILIIFVIILAILIPSIRFILTLILATIFTLFVLMIIIFIYYFYYGY
ncbi:MAG: zinc-ribbon domain-containing protein [Candidatus Odinarchaeota archaeon]